MDEDGAPKMTTTIDEDDNDDGVFPSTFFHDDMYSNACLTRLCSHEEQDHTGRRHYLLDWFFRLVASLHG